MHHFLIVFLQVLLRLVNGVLAMLIGAKTLTHLVRPVCSTAVATADAITKEIISSALAVGLIDMENQAHAEAGESPTEVSAME